MRYRIIVYLVVGLLTALQVAFFVLTVPIVYRIETVAAAQDIPPDGLILARAAAAIHNAEPEWEYIPAICNCLGLKREGRLGVAIGTLNRSLNGSSEHIDMGVSRIATAGTAARWIYRERYGHHRKGLSVIGYNLGDGANMATYTDTYRGVTQYYIAVRKGKLLASTSGQSKEAVERFARYLLTAIEMSN